MPNRLVSIIASPCNGQEDQQFLPFIWPWHIPLGLPVHCRYQAAKAELAGIETQMVALQQAQDSDTLSISGVSNQLPRVSELSCADL